MITSPVDHRRQSSYCLFQWNTDLHGLDLHATIVIHQTTKASHENGFRYPKREVHCNGHVH